MTADGRIDVHQHLIPPRYRQRLEERGLTAGGWPTPSWDPAAAIAMMDRRRIATGILSISAPGVHFGDDAEARELLERGAHAVPLGLVRAHDVVLEQARAGLGAHLHLVVAVGGNEAHQGHAARLSCRSAASLIRPSAVRNSSSLV